MWCISMAQWRLYGVYQYGTVEIVCGCISMAQWRLYWVYQYGTVEIVWGVSVWHSGDCIWVYQYGTVEIVCGCISMAQWRLYVGVSVWHSGDCWLKINVHTKPAASSVCVRLSLRRLSSTAAQVKLFVTNAAISTVTAQLSDRSRKLILSYLTNMFVRFVVCLFNNALNTSLSVLHQAMFCDVSINMKRYLS